MNPYAGCDQEHRTTIEPYIGQQVDLYDESGNAPRAYGDMTPVTVESGLSLRWIGFFAWTLFVFVLGVSVGGWR